MRISCAKLYLLEIPNQVPSSLVAAAEADAIINTALPMLQPLTCNMPGHVIMENCTTILPKSHPTACDYSSTDAHNHKACHAILGLSSTIINQWLQFCSCSQGGIFSRLPWNFVSTKLQNAARLYTLRRRHYYKKSARQYKIPPCDFVRTETQNAARRAALL